MAGGRRRSSGGPCSRRSSGAVSRRTSGEVEEVEEEYEEEYEEEVEEEEEEEEESDLDDGGDTSREEVAESGGVAGHGEAAKSAEAVVPGGEMQDDEEDEEEDQEQDAEVVEVEEAKLATGALPPIPEEETAEVEVQSRPATPSDSPAGAATAPAAAAAGAADPSPTPDVLSSPAPSPGSRRAGLLRGRQTLAGASEGVQEFGPGLYLLIRDASVTTGISRSSDLVCWLESGQTVTIVQVVRCDSECRVRGVLANEAGWISMLDTAANLAWVEFQAPLPSPPPAPEPDAALATAPPSPVSAPPGATAPDTDADAAATAAALGAALAAGGRSPMGAGRAARGQRVRARPAEVREDAEAEEEAEAEAEAEEVEAESSDQERTLIEAPEGLSLAGGLPAVLLGGRPPAPAPIQASSTPSASSAISGTGPSSSSGSSKPARVHRRSLVEMGAKEQLLACMREHGGGRVAVAWRKFFDRSDGDLTFHEFAEGLAAMGYKGDVGAAWGELSDMTAAMLPRERLLDERSARVFSAFGAWCRKACGGPLELFANLATPMSPEAFVAGLRALGLFIGGAETADLPEELRSEARFREELIPVIDPWNTGSLLPEGVLFLERDPRQRKKLRRQIEHTRDRTTETLAEYNGHRPRPPRFVSTPPRSAAGELLVSLAKRNTLLGGRHWKQAEVLPLAVYPLPQQEDETTPSGQQPRQRRSRDLASGSGARKAKPLPRPPSLPALPPAPRPVQLPKLQQSASLPDLVPAPEPPAAPAPPASVASDASSVATDAARKRQSARRVYGKKLLLPVAPGKGGHQIGDLQWHGGGPLLPPPRAGPAPRPARQLDGALAPGLMRGEDFLRRDVSRSLFERYYDSDVGAAA